MGTSNGAVTAPPETLDEILDAISEDDPLIPLSAVPDILPSHRRGRKLSLMSVRRYANEGIGGEKLWTVQGPAGLLTTRRQIFAWLARLQARRRGQSIAAGRLPSRRTASRRLRESARAAEQLKQQGA